MFDGSISRDELDAMIAAALDAHDDDVRAAWQRIRIEPARWRCSPWGDACGGFWAVAIEGDRVLWFNEIEDGFNRSAFTERGVIDEYWCNQTSFAEILDELARARQARLWPDLVEGDVPAELAGPGAITRRQTTYWELRSGGGSVYRVHFRGKVEIRFASADYPGVELDAWHPVLVHHEAPSRSLYFLGTPIDPVAAAARIDDAIRRSSSGWRSLDDYAPHAPDRLRAGHGLLLIGPDRLCADVAAALEPIGIGASIIGHREHTPGYRALVLGRSFVVAETFRFERR